MTPPGHLLYGQSGLYYAWETTATGRVRWCWDDEGLAVRYCVLNSLQLIRSLPYEY